MGVWERGREGGREGGRKGGRGESVCVCVCETCMSSEEVSYFGTKACKLTGKAAIEGGVMLVPDKSTCFLAGPCEYTAMHQHEATSELMPSLSLVLGHPT